MKPASISDFRLAAKRRLPRFLFEYVDGAAFAEQTHRANRIDLDRIELRQRVMRDVSRIDTRAELFGRPAAMPVALGPIGLGGMLARRGEVQAARAAHAVNVPFCLSTVAACSIEEMTGAGLGAPFWFQLYMIRDRAFMRDLLTTARDAGCDVLVFTVDMPVPGIRYRDKRSGLSGSGGIGGAIRRFGQALARPGWSWDVGVHGRPHQLGNIAPLLGRKSGMEDFLGWLANNFDPAIHWRDLAFVREHWPGPIVIKGILDANDAREALAAGVDGIIVSNHGGRQLDGVPSTAQALPAIARIVDGRIPVLADGGVQSGLDVVRLLALGADAVLLGRAWAFALGSAGERGVAQMLATLAAEMRVAMALTGVNTISEIGPDCLVRNG